MPIQLDYENDCTNSVKKLPVEQVLEAFTVPEDLTFKIGLDVAAEKLIDYPKF